MRKAVKKTCNEQLNLRKIKTTIRQILTKITSLENCIISHPTTDESKAIGSTANLIHWESFCQVSAPAKKHVVNFIDHFEDVVERYGCKSDLGGVSSLLQLSAFEMGKLAIEFDEEEFEDFFEDFYDFLPQHTWRYTLFGHLIHLVIKFIPLDYLLPSLANICIKHHSFHHAFDLMKAFWRITGPVSKQEYR